MFCHAGSRPPAAMCHGMSCFVMRGPASCRDVSWNVMFCHAGSRPPAAMCHGRSWSVCEWRICCVPFGHEVIVSGRGAAGFVRLGVLRHGSLPFAAVSFLQPRRRPARTAEPLVRAYRACAPAPGRARYAAARIARLIAPARARPGAGSGRGAVSVRLARLRVFGMGSSFRSRFRSSGPAAGLPGRRNPFPRVSRACALAPGRARYATARIARLIAPARARPNAGRTCPLASRWHFFAPARNGRGRDAADAAPFPPTHPSADFPKSTPVPEILQNSRTRSEITYESHQPP